MAQAHALNTNPASALPRPIREALGKIGRRLRWVSILRGLGSVLLVGTVGMVLGMAMDFAIALPVAVRLGVWGVWIVAIMGFLGSTIRRSLWRSQKESALELAGLIERKFPNVGERLTASVGLVRDGSASHGSPALIAALVHEAVDHVEQINPSNAIPSGPARRRFTQGLASAILLGLPIFLVPDPFGKLAVRFLNPWADLGRVSRIRIDVQPGDTFAAIGDDLAITAEIVARFGPPADSQGVQLEWLDPETKRIRRVAMNSASASSDSISKRSAVIPRLADSLTYRVVTTSAESRRFSVTAVEPPKIAKVIAKIVPPTYTKRPPIEAADPTKIDAFETARVELKVTAASRIKAVEVRFPKPGGRPSEFNRTLASVGSDGVTAAVSFYAGTSGPFSIRLFDPRGITSRDESPRKLTVIPDMPPTVDLQGVDGLTESNSTDTLRVGAFTGDDVSVEAVELHYKVVREGTNAEPETGKLSADFKGLGSASASGVIGLGLQSLHLKPGDSLTYRVRVADNRPAPKGPNITWSSDHSLKIVEKAESMAAKRGEAERTSVKERLEALKKTIADTKKETEQLRYAADASQRNNGAWEADRREGVTRQEAEARKLNESLQVLADELKESPAFHPLSRASEQIAQVEGEALRATLDHARQATDPVKRFNDLQKADARANDVARKIDELQRDFDTLTRQGIERERLQDLADRQAQIAEHAEKAEMNPHDRLGFDKLQAEQNAVKNELDQLLQKSPALRSELLKAQAVEAADLAGKAKDLAERQRKEASRATNLAEKSTLEKLQAIAEEQRALENETRRFAIEVNQALAENGRSPLNTDPLKRAIEPIERGEIAEGRDRIRESERELRRVSREIEDVPQDAKSLARRLFNAQQTLTNDLAQALGNQRSKPEIVPEVRAEVQEKLKRLQSQSEEIAKLAAAIPESKEALAPASNGAPAFPKDLATKAAESSKRAAEQLRVANNPQAMEKEATDAREALNALANALPDRWKVEGDIRKAFDEARNKADAVANEVDKHLRETDRPNDGQKALDDLTNRLAPLVDQARQVAEQMTKVEPGPRNDSLRDQAAGRVKELGSAIESTRKALAQHPGAKEAGAVRDALALAANRSKVAMERFNQALQGMPSDEKLAEALAAEAGELKPGDAEEARRLASGVRNIQALDAPLELAEAIRAAERAAASNANPETSKALHADAKEALQALADRLNGRQSPRGRVEALARAERSSVPNRDPAAAAALQRAVAAELTRLPLEKGENREALEAVQKAATVAEATAKPAELGETPRTDAELAKAQNEAAAALEKLAAVLPDRPENPPKAAAERLGKDLPLDPRLELNAEQAKLAADLAARERRLGERLQSVLGERAEPQQALKQEAIALGRDLASLRDRSMGVGDRARGPAQEAVNLLGQQAPQAMNEASKQLGEGQKDRAREMQRQAADFAERAARNAEDMTNALLAEKSAIDAQTLAEGAGAPKPSQGDDQGKALGEAREAMNQASRSLQEARNAGGPPQSNSAKHALRDAAKSLQAAAETQELSRARESAQSSLTSSKASKAMDPKGGKISAGKAETLAELQSLVQKKTGKTWGELPGHLRSEILEMARQPRYRDDYARLIQLYFQEIAAGAK